MATTHPTPAHATDSVAAVRMFKDLAAESVAALVAAARTTTLAPGERLFEEGSGADALYVLREGLLHACEPDPPREPRVVRIIRPDEAVDGLQEMTGARHPVAVLAAETSVVTVIPGATVDHLVHADWHFRQARDRLHRRQLLSGLHRLMGPLDDVLLDDLEREAEWLNLHRGDVVFEPGDASDALFFVISGRLAALTVLESGGETLHSERIRGDTLGESGFLGRRPRSYRARALRDSVLVGYKTDAFERLIARHPHVVRHITAGVAQRVMTPGRDARAAGSVTTIALFPAGVNAPVRDFAARLCEALSRFGSVLRLDSSRVDTMLTEPGIAQAADGTAEEQRLLTWMEGCETRHRFLVCESDPTPNAWSHRCARRADRLVLVADAKELHRLNDLERSVMPGAPGATDVRAMLVLMHPDGSRPPSHTHYWLDARPAITEHHHLRWSESADFQRIARILTGRSTGLVLGGGGARGFAHIGVLRALGEAGIPIDMVGGTSMGASIAGQYAMGRTPDDITAVTRRVFLEVKPLRGFTLPVLSLVNSRRMRLAGITCYGDVAIEDLWLPFFCVSSNLTTADVMVHQRGTLWKAALASSSLPGVGPPVLHDRQLLVDGGVLNNLPTDVMRQMGCGTVIASAVSVNATKTFTCDRVPSVWEVMSGRFSRRAATTRFPSILAVLLRSSLLHSAHRERLSVQAADLCIRAAVEEFGLLDFERIDDIIAAGYANATATVAQWRDGKVSVLG